MSPSSGVQNQWWRDDVEVAGQDPGRQHPGQAPADDHGVTAPGGGRETYPGELTARAHTILLTPV